MSNTSENQIYKNYESKKQEVEKENALLETKRKALEKQEKKVLRLQTELSDMYIQAVQSVLNEKGYDQFSEQIKILQELPTKEGFLFVDETQENDTQKLESDENNPTNPSKLEEKKSF